jgi:hypothetical protein
MSELDTIVVLHTTSWEDDAQTDANFQLEITTSGDRVIKAFDDLPHNEREPGQTDIYQFDVSGDKIDAEDPGLLITMRMLTPRMAGSLCQYSSWEKRRLVSISSSGLIPSGANGSIADLLLQGQQSM